MADQSPIHSIALGVGTKNQNGEWLEVFFANPLINVASSVVASLGKAIDWNGGNQTIELTKESLSAISEALGKISDSDAAAQLKKTTEQFQNSSQPLVAVIIEKDLDPQTVPEVYLKLQLLSHCLVKPHELNLNGIFGLLPNVAWTNLGAIDLQELPQRQLDARLKGETLQIYTVDKFPKMTDYVVPKGVRIAATSRVRLGAYLGEGTTIMHEGFVNFNAGTMGPNMVEGRISAGVIIGAGSDLGGGCSTMGTLSGGGQTIISVGKDCLLGANAGLGIPLGDRCTIEAGLYLTAASKVSVLDQAGKVVEVLKAAKLSGKSDLLFRRNSQTGTIECLTNKSAIELNTELHANN